MTYFSILPLFPPFLLEGDENLALNIEWLYTEPRASSWVDYHREVPFRLIATRQRDFYYTMADEHALQLIKDEFHDEFNAYIAEKANGVDLSEAHLRSYDLRKFNLKKANLTNAYLRACDLSALDLSGAILEGASIKNAKVSGARFPRDISAQEIMMSLEHGTRIRQGL